VPDYPRLVTGRDTLIGLYRGYQSAFFLDRCFDLRVHRADDSTVTLEYTSEGRAVATGRPYGNRYISVVTISDRKIVHWRDSSTRCAPWRRSPTNAGSMPKRDMRARSSSGEGGSGRFQSSCRPAK
jgi:hypothetical protein